MNHHSKVGKPNMEIGDLVRVNMKAPIGIRIISDESRFELAWKHFNLPAPVDFHFDAAIVKIVKGKARQEDIIHVLTEHGDIVGVWKSYVTKIPNSI